MAVIACPAVVKPPCTQSVTLLEFNFHLDDKKSPGMIHLVLCHTNESEYWKNWKGNSKQAQKAAKRMPLVYISLRGLLCSSLLRVAIKMAGNQTAVCTGALSQGFQTSQVQSSEFHINSSLWNFFLNPEESEFQGNVNSQKKHNPYLH